MIVLYERRYDARLPTRAIEATPAGLIRWVSAMRSSVVLIGLLAIGFDDAKAQASRLLVVAQLQDMPAQKPMSSAPGLAAPPATSTDQRVPSANPLWTIPIASLTATRDRPLFSPSRRPPQPVVVAKPAAPPPPPPKPAEPEKPQLSLTGTIMGESGERIGLFVNADDKSALRLKVGEDNKGWVLREVLPRQVVLEKGQQIAVLEFPRHEMNKVASVPPAAPANRKVEAVADEVSATSSSTVNSPNSSAVNDPKPTAAASVPPLQARSPVVAPTFMVQPPANPEPQVNPFEKAWLSKRLRP